MKRFASSFCAAALAAAVTVTGLLPASAAPVYVPQPAQASQQSDVMQVRDARQWRRLERRAGRADRRWDRRWDRRDARKFYRGKNNYGWYNGHRGYRYKRPGYRYYDGWWYPGGAFIAGAIIGGAIANSNDYPRYSGGGNAHVQWCYDRYRSYRAYDNTFQPYNGPRRQCYSPYS